MLVVGVVGVARAEHCHCRRPHGSAAAAPDTHAGFAMSWIGGHKGTITHTKVSKLGTGVYKFDSKHGPSPQISLTALIECEEFRAMLRTFRLDPPAARPMRRRHTPQPRPVALSAFKIRDPRRFEGASSGSFVGRYTHALDRHRYALSSPALSNVCLAVCTFYPVGTAQRRPGAQFIPAERLRSALAGPGQEHDGRCAVGRRN